MFGKFFFCLLSKGINICAIPSHIDTEYMLVLMEHVLPSLHILLQKKKNSHVDTFEVECTDSGCRYFYILYSESYVKISVRIFD